MEIKPKDFILPQKILEKDIDYKLAEALEEDINAAAILTGKCFTIFDYYKNEYYYISDNSLFFSKSPRNKKSDYQLLVDNSDEEGIYLMHYIQKQAFDFLLKQPVNEITNYVFSLNVGMLSGENRIDTLYKIKPQVLDKKGNIWLSLATLEKANIFTKPQVYNTKTGKVYYFTPLKSESFENRTKKLTKQEVSILASMAEERSTQEICSEFQIKEPTYKRHRSEIYRKLGVKSKISAVNRAYVYGIIC
jgi:DNA-binding NarL/FixJ family response regulator